MASTFVEMYVCIALFCHNLLTGETPQSAELLYNGTALPLVLLIGTVVLLIL